MSAGAHDADLAALSLLDEPVRRRLYDLVAARDEPIGRDEAARALGITRSLATFHLDRLADSGLLESGYQRLTGRSGPGAGRPARIYWRGERQFAVSLPDRRYELVADMFASALEQIGQGSAPPALRTAAAEAGEATGRTGSQGSAEQRLLASLARAGYEPQAEGATVRLRNCPFDALVERHRQLVCGTNLAFGEGLVRGARADDYRPLLDPQPGYCCVAFVREPGSA